MNWIKEKLASILLRGKNNGFVYFGHGVCAHKSNDFIEHLHINKNDLIDVIEFWKRMNVSFLSMDEVIELSDSGFVSKKPWVHFSFDDGYKNNLITLLPIIERYNMPATIFVSTGLIENINRMPGYFIRTAIVHTNNLEQWIEKNKTLFKGCDLLDRVQVAKVASTHYKSLAYKESTHFLGEIKSLLTEEEWSQYNSIYNNEELLTPEELKELARHPLITIGTHGSFHHLLHAKQKESLMKSELEDPFFYIKEHLQSIPSVHAYPNGSKNDYTDLSHKILQKLAYKISFTTKSDFVSASHHINEIPRLTLTPKAGWIVKKWLGFK